MPLSSPRILLIDSYDSFTHNLAALCRKASSDTHVHIIRNDQLSTQQLISILPQFAAVVVGPGPGSPQRPEDIGVISQLWKLPDHSLVPVFGVCLGLQSLAIEFGARLARLNVVKHGQISRIQHHGTGLFKGVGETHAVRYHSLHYHPESVRTAIGGLQVLQNFWRLAKSWYAFKGRSPQPWSTGAHSLVGPPWPQPPLAKPLQYDLPNMLVTDICDILGATNESAPFVLLESTAQPGRFSIIGCVNHDSLRLSYNLGDDRICLSRGKEQWSEPLGHYDVWSWLTTFMQSRKASGGPENVPFWGGLVGYLGYELGLKSLQTPAIHRKGAYARQHPDLNLVLVERSIVMDSHLDDVYVQSIKTNDHKWIEEIVRCLTQASTTLPAISPAKPPVALFSQAPIVHLPHEKTYKSRIVEAKEHLFAGDSYELCLTAHTRIMVHPRQGPTSSSWELYKRLRRQNPAPYAGFLRLHPSTLLSSSPERFLSFTRPPHSRYQLRPIKGTVRKAPGITREVAEELLAGSKKEVAENLMIVDLIRHDLHGVVGENVSVKQFCRVEEYETVWQMVSVIEGAGSISGLDPDSCELGWEVLKKSLPPGEFVSFAMESTC
ncbi:ADC synthase [Lactifluus volemus]|nr:ADC synthase [Lactifluus volemus]